MAYKYIAVLDQASQVYIANTVASRSGYVQILHGKMDFLTHIHLFAIHSSPGCGHLNGL